MEGFNGLISFCQYIGFPAPLPDDLAVLYSEDTIDTKYNNWLLSTFFVQPNYLNAVAKRVTGNTALQLVHEQVINIAKIQLLNSKLSIKEIAWLLSFKKTTHFITFFKKRSGLPPLEFRKKQKNG